jgi:hypothetical protein
VWDPKITTLPGVYVAVALIVRALDTMVTAPLQLPLSTPTWWPSSLALPAVPSPPVSVFCTAPALRCLNLLFLLLLPLVVYQILVTLSNNGRRRRRRQRQCQLQQRQSKAKSAAAVAAATTSTADDDAADSTAAAVATVATGDGDGDGDDQRYLLCTLRTAEVCVSPVLFCTGVLFYTDVLSLLLTLACYLAALRVHTVDIDFDVDVRVSVGVGVGNDVGVGSIGGGDGAVLRLFFPRHTTTAIAAWGTFAIFTRQTNVV